MQKVKLKEVCTLINGRAYKQEELLDSGKYPVLRVGNFFSDKDYYYSDLELEEDKYCDSGDLLFAWSASFGPKIWNGGKVIYHYHIWKMVLEDAVNKEYLYYYLYYLSERIKAEGHGGIMIHTTKAEMEERELSLPDMSKQCEIAKVLNQLSAIIEKRQTEIKELDNLIKARFVEMFFDKGYPVLGWNDVFNTTTGKLDSNAMVEDGKYPFFTCAKEVYRIDKYAFDQEALLLAGNNAAGKYDVKYYKGKFNAYQRTYVLGLKQEWSYRLFQYQLEDKLVYLQQQSLGGLTKYLTMKILGGLSFIIPPMEQQIEFESFVKQVDKSKVAVQKSLDETQKLFDSLMQEYFG